MFMRFCQNMHQSDHFSNFYDKIDETEMVETRMDLTKVPQSDHVHRNQKG